jgi:hypothetical protein
VAVAVAHKALLLYQELQEAPNGVAVLVVEVENADQLAIGVVVDQFLAVVAAVAADQLFHASINGALAAGLWSMLPTNV